MTYRVSVLSQINYPTVLNSMAQVRVEITSDVSPDGGVTIIPIQVRDLGFATIGSYTTLVTPTYVYSAEGSITFEALNTISNFRLVFPNCTDLTVASVATLKASVTIQNMSAQTSACSAPTTAIYVISPSSSLAF